VWQVDVLTAEARISDATALRLPLNGAPPAALIYPPGHPGAAKGPGIPPGNLAANGLTLVVAWRITAADRLLLALPLFHVHGLGNGVHCWLRSGCRPRPLERFDHARAATTLLDFRPTLFFGVPTMYVRLLDVEGASARGIGQSPRLAVSGRS